MSKFSELTKYLEKLDNDEFGKWIFDTEHKGTKDDPIQFPFPIYTDAVDELIDAVYDYIEKCSEYDLHNYGNLIKRYKIRDLKSADIDSLNEEATLALLVWVILQEKFCDGLILGHLQSGHIQHLLRRLKELDGDTQPASDERNPVYYEYDIVNKDVLIRKIDKDHDFEILHKGAKSWKHLRPREDDPDELYTRALWLGQGCWECLETVSEEEVEQIMKDWGYSEIPPGDPEADWNNPMNKGQEKLNSFSGKLKKILIESNNVCYGPCPMPDEETEQHLTINRDGMVWLTRLSYGGNSIEKTNFKTDKKKVEELFHEIEKRFEEGDVDDFTTDIGSWSMTLTNDSGEEFLYSSSLDEYEGKITFGLSDMIRDAVGREDLFALDGNPDKITELELEYTRESKIKPRQLPDGATYEYFTWNYSETLTIDRATETLINHIQFAEAASITNTYKIQGGICSLLDSMWPEMFDDVQGNPEDAVDDPLEQKKYKLTVRTKNGVEKIVEGSYDKLALPEDWPEFIGKIYDFLAFYGIGEIFNERYYGKSKRRNSDYIFCDVEFEAGGKTYCYIADDDSYAVNDTVLVPAGQDNHESIVRIVAINYCSAEEAPFPVDKAKHIIRKIDEDEIDGETLQA